jgi:uncharacterized membrane protein
MADINASPEQPQSPLATGHWPLATGHSPLTTPRTFSLWQTIVVAIVMMTALGGYLLVLNWRGDDARFITYTALDEIVPFQPAWVWVYLIPYLIGPVVIGYLRRGTFNWYISRGIAVVLVTLIIFMVVPTQTRTSAS